MLERIFGLLCCHFLGDYVLQTDYLARTKNESRWSMLAHCFLYTLPFMMFMGWRPWMAFMLTGSHYLIDSAKGRWKVIDDRQDQALHLAFLLILCFV